MNRLLKLTNEREIRSAEDSFAQQRVKLYKELRRLADLDAPVAKPAPGETSGVKPEMPAPARPRRNS